ncbi:hypothetical protein [Halobaculum lipolyticum]|uniref:Uncharacterized protein n=1 Tax=Halobaculum lipolyticum TaxID=3032001 RepID=A0ABD5WBX4_9EURY|nr:hypothetical protein [Halobaculum sp. DT31]
MAVEPFGAPVGVAAPVVVGDAVPDVGWVAAPAAIGVDAAVAASTATRSHTTAFVRDTTAAWSRLPT